METTQEKPSKKKQKNPHVSFGVTGGCVDIQTEKLVEGLTVLRDLQDVADQWAVAIKGSGPREVDGPPLRQAQERDRIFWSVGELPVDTRIYEYINICVKTNKYVRECFAPVWEEQK